MTTPYTNSLIHKTGINNLQEIKELLNPKTLKFASFKDELGSVAILGFRNDNNGNKSSIAKVISQMLNDAWTCDFSLVSQFLTDLFTLNLQHKRCPSNKCFILM